MTDTQPLVKQEARSIQIKGIRNGLLVSKPETSWDDFIDLLISKIENENSFFKGAKLALEVGETELRAVELAQLRDRLSDRGVGLWAVLSSCEVTINTARMLGLETAIGKPEKVKEKETPPQKGLQGDPAVFIEKTLRAGYRVETKNHVIVLGDVNPGAEIISGGNIIVWGRLSGAVYAGAEGDHGAIISALEFRPTQLRIADLMTTPLYKKGKSSPETASIKENKIVIEVWNSKKS